VTLIPIHINAYQTYAKVASKCFSLASSCGLFPGGFFAPLTGTLEKRVGEKNGGSGCEEREKWIDREMGREE
jgi:hypothetical protein